MIVIQCAATKRADAGTLTTEAGTPVKFVADPALAPPTSGVIHARPDDPAGDGVTWRDRLLAYNASGRNPNGLLRAFELYLPGVYGELVHRFGAGRVFILSAGWGLIPADFLTPDYDITFSASARGADRYKFRHRRDRYRDFNYLPRDITDPVFFFGGKDYVPLFSGLTEQVRSRRIVFYNSDTPPDAPGCELHRYETSTRTNWHYGCARGFIAAAQR